MVRSWRDFFKKYDGIQLAKFEILLRYPEYLCSKVILEVGSFYVETDKKILSYGINDKNINR